MNYKNLLNIYFFLAFLFTAQPCDTFNMTDAAKPLSILFMFGASLFMCLHFKIKLNSRPLIYGFIAMGIWGGLQIVVLQRPTSPIVFIELFVTYTIFSLYKKDLPARFEHISVKMAILSLVLWAICLVAYEPLYALAKAVGSPVPIYPKAFTYSPYPIILKTTADSFYETADILGNRAGLPACLSSHFGSTSNVPD